MTGRSLRLGLVTGVLDGRDEFPRVGGERHRFCCASCQARYEERYERLDADA
ncbi:hypothetical protein [Halobacterium wangiae]|uniref:hypothetical protein n=1 Tax=Halobacterium wangiae TaxID=2902623 RepID=UPI003D7BABFA